MSPRARAYQEQITGRTGEVYLYNGAEFDGMRDNVLVEAKGLGYAHFVKGGSFLDWVEGKQRIIAQARTQSLAAGGIPLEWHVAEPEMIPVLRSLFADEGISGITLLHTPALQ